MSILRNHSNIHSVFNSKKNYDSGGHDDCLIRQDLTEFSDDRRLKVLYIYRI
jgi:hypothetical protein